jgi:pilus assembly protein CpaC
MTNISIRRRARLGSALAALALGLGTVAVATPAIAAQPAAARTYRPSAQVQLSTGEGQMIRLPSNVADVWTSNPAVADVYVSNSRQINLFGKEFGEATVIATAADGSVVYGANVRVSQNLPTINQVLKAAMPDSDIRVMTIGQRAILTGTVASPEDAALAASLASAELNPGVDLSKEGAMCKICVLNRLKTATPLQVMLKVKIAEVNRSLLKQIGVNLLSSDPTSGFKFGIGQGAANATSGPGSSPFDVNSLLTGGTTLGAAGRLFGLDIAGAIDLAAKDGLVSILAEPNLTALSGETASFLAGGEFPVPISQALGAVTIE